MSNTPKVDRTNAPDHPAQPLARRFQRNSAEILKPQGFEIQASATVHLYERHDLGQSDFIFICQMTGFENVPEHEADAAYKELHRTMMGMYGRKPPKRRGEVQ